MFGKRINKDVAAVIKRVTIAGVPQSEKSRICLCVSLKEAQKVLHRDTEATVSKMIQECRNDASITCPHISAESPYTKLEVGDTVIEWMISSDICGAGSAKHAVVGIYSWALENPYELNTTLFKTKEMAKDDLMDRYCTEKEADTESGYEFESSIDEESRWAQIKNFRAFPIGDNDDEDNIDITDWMYIPVAKTLS